MARTTTGGASIYGAPRTRKEKLRYKEETGKSWPESTKKRNHYADRSGPVVVVKPPNNPDARYDESQERYANPPIRRKVLKRDGYTCRYCGDPVTNETANIDHVHPFKHGGRTNLDNLVTSCQPCNKSKGNALNVKPRK